MMVTSAGTDNTTGLYLGSVMITTTNVGPVAVPTPWTITIDNPYYLGVSQVILSITPYLLEHAHGLISHSMAYVMGPCTL